ncbi:hypothetical protein SDC9_115355 [bioreactor metagenome]|uniref:Uncharacterized protein n=1 Tax=bioreactor metagenome TaxID=1076179 RepID=A0A645BZ88_9ZZZZ
MRQLGRLSPLQGAADGFGVLRGGGQLIAVFQLEQPEAPALEAVPVRQPLTHRVHRGAVHLQGQAKPLHAHRLPGGEQDALNGRFQFL